MNQVRRAISLGLALLLFVAGAGFLIYLFAFADHFRGWAVMAGAMMAVLGAFWLYEDFINATPNS